MKPQRIKSLSTLPFISGIMFILYFIFHFLMGFNKFADKDTETVSEVEITTKDDLGSVINKRTEIRHGTDIPGYLSVAFVVFCFFFYDKILGTSIYILTETPYLMLTPLFIAGFIASLFKKDIKNFTKGEVISFWSVSWHYVAGLILSFFITYCLFVLGAFELKYVNVFTIIALMIPTSIFVFVSFVAPISLSITAIITHLRIKKFKSLYSPVLISFILLAYIFNSGYSSKLKDFGAGYVLDQAMVMTTKFKRKWGYKYPTGTTYSKPTELKLFNGTGNNYYKATKIISGELKQNFDDRKEYLDERVKHGYEKGGPMSYKKFKELKSTSGYKEYKEQKLPPKGKGSLVLEVSPKYSTTIEIKRQGNRTIIPYEPGMLLNTGNYYLTVSSEGYKTKAVTVKIKDQLNTLERIKLQATK